MARDKSERGEVAPASVRPYLQPPRKSSELLAERRLRADALDLERRKWAALDKMGAIAFMVLFAAVLVWVRVELSARANIERGEVAASTGVIR